jgi:hypothetical protein
MPTGGRSGEPATTPVQPRRQSRWHPWLRALLAGPCAVGLTFLIFVAMPYWVPKGDGGVNHIVFPLSRPASFSDSPGYGSNS